MIYEHIADILSQLPLETLGILSLFIYLFFSHYREKKTSTYLKLIFWIENVLVWSSASLLHESMEQAQGAHSPSSAA